MANSCLELWRRARASRQLSFWWKTLVLIGHYGTCLMIPIPKFLCCELGFGISRWLSRDDVTCDISFQSSGALPFLVHHWCQLTFDLRAVHSEIKWTFYCGCTICWTIISGKGMKVRTRLYMVSPQQQTSADCNVNLMEKTDCKGEKSSSKLTMMMMGNISPRIVQPSCLRPKGKTWNE